MIQLVQESPDVHLIIQQCHTVWLTARAYSTVAPRQAPTLQLNFHTHTSVRNQSMAKPPTVLNYTAIHSDKYLCLRHANLRKKVFGFSTGQREQNSQDEVKPIRPLFSLPSSRKRSVCVCMCVCCMATHVSPSIHAACTLRGRGSALAPCQHSRVEASCPLCMSVLLRAIA